MSMERPLPGVGLSWRQLGGVAGIVGVVLFVVGILMQGDAPMMNDSVADTQAWYADNGEMYLVADFVIGIGVIVFLLPFFIVLRSVLAAAEGGQAHWSQLAFYGALLFIVLGGAGASFQAPLALTDGEIDEAVVPALQSASFYVFGSLSLAMLPFFLGIAMVIKGAGVFWGWLAWLTLALAVVALVSSAAPIEADPEGALSMIGFVSFIGLGVTILLLSVGLLSNREASS